MLGRVQTKWFKIGIQLGIPHNKLQEFEKESDPLSTVVSYWLNGNVPESAAPISWKAVVNALKSEHVGEPGLADEISKKYGTQETINIEATSNSSDEATSSSDDKMDPDVKEDLEYILERNLRRIIVTYGCYVNTIRDILTERGVIPENLIGYLLTLPAFNKSTKGTGQQLALLYDKKTELKECNTIPEIFIFLYTCASFLDYEIFQDILNYYKIKTDAEDQKRLKYSEYLESFANKHKVSELVKVNPLLKTYTKDSKKLVLKFDVEQTCRLARVRNLKRFIAEILDLNPSTLQIIDIKEGCVVVTFLIPTSVAEVIFTSDTAFTPQQEEELRANSVLWLECNGHTFDFENDSQANSPDHVGMTAGTARTSSQTKVWGVEKVRKQLANIFTESAKYLSVMATPLHGAVESHDTGSVRNLLKSTEKTKSLTSTIKPQPFVSKLLSEDERSVLRKLGIYDKIIGNLHNDACQFDTLSATPFNKATGSYHSVKKMLKQADYGVNCTDSIGWTPLHYACAMGNLDMVTILISEFRADLTIKDEHGITALMLASLAGHDSVVLTLLSECQCPDINAALFMACAGGHTSLVRTLILEHNADAHSQYYDDLSPLEMAAWCGKDEVALTLINEFKCNTMVKGALGRSLLHLACGGGSIRLVETLILEHKVKVTDRDDHNDTPLHVAAFRGKEKLALTLINKFGCNIRAKGRYGRSLLHMACYGGSVNLVQALLIEHNADANARDDHNNTPLHVAALHGKDEVVLTLINKFGCDVNLKGCFGRTLLHQACYGGSINLVQTLIHEHNADVNATDLYRDTPLHIAALRAKPEVAVTLIKEFGCNIKSKGRLGSSLLHQACVGGSVNLVRTLIHEYNADINARDDNNNTPLDVAAICGHDEVVVTILCIK